MRPVTEQWSRSPPQKTQAECYDRGNLARVVEWQTRTAQDRLPQGVEVRLLSRAPLTICQYHPVARDRYWHFVGDELYIAKLPRHRLHPGVLGNTYHCLHTDPVPGTLCLVRDYPPLPVLVPLFF